ncbi:hypothetical protein A9Q74_07030 [Colwellia sp. 39_35_sub15_T18]|nr:hypothetical protein A9Q74_07030 [Colwellia sp. 39_35_sub15_T18]
MIKLGKYQHFKGSFYQVIHLARHSETEEYLVVYHPFSNSNDIWVRPLAMFTEAIERNGKTIQRFQLVAD